MVRSCPAATAPATIFHSLTVKRSCAIACRGPRKLSKGSTVHAAEVEARVETAPWLGRCLHSQWSCVCAWKRCVLSLPPQTTSLSSRSVIHQQPSRGPPWWARRATRAETNSYQATKQVVVWSYQANSCTPHYSSGNNDSLGVSQLARAPRVGTHNMRVCVSYVSLPSIGVDVPAH